MELLVPPIPDSPAQAREWLCAEGAWAHQMPADGLATAIDTRGGSLVVKLGLDPTMPSLHLGHWLVLRRLRWFQVLGASVVVILGDVTASIGDPTGRDASRPALSPDAIDSAARHFEAQLARVLDMDHVTVRRNSEWLVTDATALLTELRGVTVNQLLARADFSARLAANQPLSVLELVYPIAQALDSVAVGSGVEMGGDDQTTNLSLARDVQRAHGQDPQVCLTLPILVGTDGVVKMSKSLDNIVALDHDPDTVVGRCLRLPDDAMAGWASLLFGVDMLDISDPWQAKRRLAASVAEVIHPGQGLAALAAWERVHRDRQVPDEMPVITADVSDGQVHLPVLIQAAFGGSRGDARRHLASGAVRVDGRQVTSLDVDTDTVVGRVLSVGTRRFCRVG